MNTLEHKLSQILSAVGGIDIAPVDVDDLANAAGKFPVRTSLRVERGGRTLKRPTSVRWCAGYHVKLA